jgi:DNA invertase Pin-like site-specific DNA recombinase
MGARTPTRRKPCEGNAQEEVMVELESQCSIPVAQYVRMSTDHQRYSIDNQRSAIADYAALHGMVVVRTYADEGRSGLTLTNRDGLKSLLDDVQSKARGFDLVLVYDISRWGRFQDADESAFYEYLLRRAGVGVVYCAEPFDNDGSPASTILKSVKRAMAAEYSRELSAKVSRGQRRMAERGFRLGSHAGYGLRRLAISENGARRQLLERGERKSVHTDRIILVPGPPDEVATVRRIFALYVRARLGPKRIARRLAMEGAPTGVLPHWYGGAIDNILTNEKYVGVSVFGKQTCRLRGRRIANPRETWVRIERAFEPIVEQFVYDAAQGIRCRRCVHLSDEEALNGLLVLKRREGAITSELIASDPELPSVAFYREHFGSLMEAYRRIGHEPVRRLRSAKH